MRRMYEFTCSDGHKTESLVSQETRAVPCKTCALTAQRIISAVRPKLDPISGDFPGATMKWAKGRQKQILHERKYNPEG